MDISDIELIRSISDTGSLSRASERLFLSQPTLSKKLARLESQLNTQLFVRYPKGLVPTEVAQYILSKADPLREQLAEIERHVVLMNQLERGQLKLGVGPIIEQVLLPEVLMEFIDTTGDVQLSVITEDDETLLQLFAASELDVIVGPFQAEEWQRRDIVSLPMIQDRVIAVARQDHPVFQQTNVDEKLLAQYPWVAPQAQGTVLQSNDIPDFLDLKIVSENYDLMKKLALSTNAVCAGPGAVFKQDIDVGHLRELQFPLSLQWESALLVRPETMVTPLARHLVSLFEDAAEKFCY